MAPPRMVLPLQESVLGRYRHAVAAAALPPSRRSAVSSGTRARNGEENPVLRTESGSAANATEQELQAPPRSRPGGARHVIRGGTGSARRINANWRTDSRRRRPGGLGYTGRRGQRQEATAGSHLEYGYASNRARIPAGDRGARSRQGTREPPGGNETSYRRNETST